MDICEFSLFCEKILDFFFLKNKNSPLSWNENNEEWKIRNLVLCMVLTCCQLDKMWVVGYTIYFFIWIGQIGSCILI